MTAIRSSRPIRCLLLATVLSLPMLLAVGCATTPPAPSPSLAAARQAITNAERSDARTHAADELAEARERLRLAEGAVRDERMLEAERFADEAKLSAELASAITETSKALESNQELIRSVQALIDETHRTGGQP